MLFVVSALYAPSCGLILSFLEDISYHCCADDFQLYISFSHLQKCAFYYNVGI